MSEKENQYLRSVKERIVSESTLGAIREDLKKEDFMQDMKSLISDYNYSIQEVIVILTRES